MKKSKCLHLFIPIKSDNWCNTFNGSERVIVKMKKILSVFLTIVLFSVFSISAFGAVSYRVYADDVEVTNRKSISIPIKIENNKGIMGFKIIFSYDSTILTPISAKKDKKLNGMFNDNIETAQRGSFFVVWSGTEDFLSNGELFVVDFFVDEKATGTKTIKLSYSKKDTFKEDWTDVALNCEEINIVCSNAEGANTSQDDETKPDDSVYQNWLTTFVKWIKNLYLKIIQFILPKI